MREQNDKKRSSPERESKEGESANLRTKARSEDQPAGPAPTSARLLSGADVHAYIGRQLRAVYDDVAKQPVPDRFLDLIKQLDARTGGR